MHSSCTRVCECAHLLVSLPSASISIMHKNTNFPPSLSPSPCWWRWQLKLLCNLEAVRHHFAAVIQMFHLTVHLCQPISSHYLRVGDGLFIFGGIELSEGLCRISVQTNIAFIRFLLFYFILCFKLGNEMYCSYQQTKLPINCRSFIVKNRVNLSFIFRFGW